MLPLILFVLMLISLGNLLYFLTINMIILSIIFKTLTSLLFVLIAVFSYKENSGNKKYFNIMLIGLACSFVGDVFLAFSTKGTFFVLGLISFSSAQILYSIGFSIITKLTFRDIAIFAIISSFLISFVTLKDGFDFGGMYPMLILYIILISFMVAKAFSFWRIRKRNLMQVKLIISGAVLFLISDFVLLFILFYTYENNLFMNINLITYYLGQAFFALSFNKSLEIEKLN